MQIYLVGGAVRDQLLSLSVRERDWVVVGATPQLLLKQGFRQVGRDFPVFLHPESNDEYALARTERKSGAGHCGFEVFSSPDVTLEEDLQRRDLTINAIAQDENGSLIDPYDGQADIKRRVLRHVSPAFIEDPLRVLRVARFAARFWALGFTIAPETLALMTSISNSGELEQLSKERIWQETKRALESDHPEIFILVLLQAKALIRIAPSLATALETKSALLNLSQLRLIKDNTHRYACLVLIASNLNGEFCTDTANEINKSFACPNDFQQLTMLLVKYFAPCCSAIDSSSEQIYSILHALDAFRRQSRCLQVIQCINSAQIIFPLCIPSSLLFLQQLIPMLNKITLSDEDKEKLNGKAIGEKIKSLRIQAIDEQLSKIK